METMTPFPDSVDRDSRVPGDRSVRNAGVRGKDGRVIASLDRDRAKALVDDGTIEGGMLPKVEACLVAAGAGCRAAIVAARDIDAGEDSILSYIRCLRRCWGAIWAGTNFAKFLPKSRSLGVWSRL